MPDQIFPVVLILIILSVVIFVLLLVLLVEGIKHIWPQQRAAVSPYQLTMPSAVAASSQPSSRPHQTNANARHEVLISVAQDDISQVETSQYARSSDAKSQSPTSENAITEDPANGAQAAFTFAPPRPVAYDELNRKQRAALHKQAQRDYEQARGAAHQRLLSDTRSRHEQEKQRLEKRLKELPQQSEAMQRAYQGELQQALEHHLIYDRLNEVDGIGPELKTRILVFLKPTTLTDLRRAETVPGVGESRMAGIAVWISQYSQQMSALLTKPFPGRDAIDRRFSAQSQERQKNRDQTQAALATLGKKIAEIDRHLTWLKSISVETYMEAARGEADAQAQIARYTVGLFPEWEPLPVWYKQLVDGKETA